MTQTPPPPNPVLLAQMNVSGPVFVAETPYAIVWKVARQGDTPAALKIYKLDMDNEAAGFAMLRHWNGNGAAHLYGQTETAALLEWLEGPSLGDIVRGGDDEMPTRVLVEVANTLHNSPARPRFPLETLDDWFADLFAATYVPDCPPEARATLRGATAIAQRLLAETTAQRALHGDLHHDNIIQTPRGPVAFDAKGVMGNRLYELANAFRNPLGAESHVNQPGAAKRRADTWAQAFDTTPNALLEWAAAHGALSLAWSSGGRFGPEQAQDVRHIDTLLRQIT